MILPPQKKSAVSDPTSAQHAFGGLTQQGAQKNRSLRVLPIHRCGRVEVKPWDTLSLNFNPCYMRTIMVKTPVRKHPRRNPGLVIHVIFGVPFRLTCIISKMV